MIGFAIYALEAGGGTLAISPMPGRTRHYYTDWLHLSDWRPDLVITMTPQSELERKGAGTLGSDLAQAGVAWRHFPVADFGTPSARQMTEWRDIAKLAQETLARRGRVLVHCYGGCGRSGMAVLRIMIAVGEAPDAALARLRRIRPCAIETEDQMAWAQSES